ncbi:MAG: hypothetical protein JXA38_07985 [Methanosarcinaceae archaeon]|nr:hypothetical protein [Methanosarcinaceae archaeon]
MKSVILSHPNQGIKYNEQEQTIYIPELKLEVKHNIPVIFEKINQIEIDDEYLYLAVIVSEKSEYKTDK